MFREDDAMHRWQAQEAKNKFSEVARKAKGEGPQMVIKRGKDNVVIMSVEDYRTLRRPETGLVEFLRNSPLAEVDLDVERDQDTGRELDL
jgi:prevent-host-death family protein